MRTEGIHLYLKIDRNSCVNHPKVLLSDVAKIECENEALLRKVKQLPIYNFKGTAKGQSKHTTVSV